MNTIFDPDNRAQLIHRIEHLHESYQPQWGKMNLIQMLKHNTYWNGWVLGKGNPTYQQAFMGKLFGKIALKRMLMNDRPFDKNIPTSNQFKVTATKGGIAAEKAKWISLLKDYDNFDNPNFIHDFFGNMTREQIGVLVYKHTDHHLRQFGV